MGDPVGMRRGQRHCNVPTAQVGDHRGLWRLDGIEDGERVVHPGLEDWQLGGRNRVREAGPALVEHDDPAEGRKALP